MGWLGPNSTVCRANAVAVEGPGLSLRYRVMRGSSGGGAGHILGQDGRAEAPRKHTVSWESGGHSHRGLSGRD